MSDDALQFPAGMEGERTSPPPLLAYTSSAQSQNRPKGKTPNRKNGSRSTPLQSRPRQGRSSEKISFDEDARREFLTGFRKRKQARIEYGREKAKLREKEERRVMRQDAREARKKRAEENVKAEKIAYGGESSFDDDSDEESEHVPELPSAYDTDAHHTTVTVEEWVPQEEGEAKSQHIKNEGKSDSKRSQGKNIEKLPPSSRRAARKVKGEAPQGKLDSGDTRGVNPKVRRAGDISKLMEGEERDDAYIPELVQKLRSNDSNEAVQEGSTGKEKSVAKRQPKFRYESKLERAKTKAQIKEVKQKRAEKRKEEGAGRKRATRGKGKIRGRKSK